MIREKFAFTTAKNTFDLKFKMIKIDLPQSIDYKPKRKSTSIFTFPPSPTPLTRQPTLATSHDDDHIIKISNSPTLSTIKISDLALKMKMKSHLFGLAMTSPSPKKEISRLEVGAKMISWSPTIGIEALGLEDSNSNTSNFSSPATTTNNDININNNRNAPNNNINSSSSTNHHSSTKTNHITNINNITNNFTDTNNTVHPTFNDGSPCAIVHKKVSERSERALMKEECKAPFEIAINGY